MKVPIRKNVNWDLKRRRFKLKERIRRWRKRYVRRQKIRSYIDECESDVVKAISLKGVYSISLEDSWEKDDFYYYVYAYKLIAMRYGLDMRFSDTCVARMYSITLKKKE